MHDKEKSQSERFEETARELGVDFDEDKLKEALRKIATPVDCPGKFVEYETTQGEDGLWSARRVSAPQTPS